MTETKDSDEIFKGADELYRIQGDDIATRLAAIKKEKGWLKDILLYNKQILLYLEKREESLTDQSNFLRRLKEI